jgi:hypothetical protein
VSALHGSDVVAMELLSLLVALVVAGVAIYAGSKSKGGDISPVRR